MMIRIKKEGVRPGPRIETTEGTPIEGVRAVTIRMAPEDLVVAEMDVLVEAVDIVAHPLLSLDSLERAARHHGFRLFPESDD